VKGIAARFATTPYLKRKRRNVLTMYFDENWRMSEIAREKHMPSYTTIKRWVAKEKRERQERATVLSDNNPRRGRPRLFSNEELMKMKSFTRESLAEGRPVRRIDLAKAIGRDHGPHKVSLQRISDYRTELRLSHKRPVAKPKKQVLYRLNVPLFYYPINSFCRHFSNVDIKTNSVSIRYR